MNSRGLLFTSFLFLFSFLLGYSQTLKVMTYNIRYDNPNDGKNGWQNRRELIVGQIKSNTPDIIGFQEGLVNQVKYLSENLLDYSYVGVGREDGKEKGEYAAIFYRSDKYRVISDSTFWLSPTHEKPSVGWDAALERICTYTLLEEIENGNRFWMFNTHLDHIGKIARKESSNLILEKIDKLNQGSKLPVILTGDMNSIETDEPIVILKTKLVDTFYEVRHMESTLNETFNGFNVDQVAKERIDYIFVNRYKVKVKSHSTLIDKIDGRYPSDHFPVISVIAFE
jgi:endonuclease/exonuclease/phosphatase family metal-dependent hydrolase